MRQAETRLQWYLNRGCALAQASVIASSCLHVQFFLPAEEQGQLSSSSAANEAHRGGHHSSVGRSRPSSHRQWLGLQSHVEICPALLVVPARQAPKPTWLCACVLPDASIPLPEAWSGAEANNRRAARQDFKGSDFDALLIYAVPLAPGRTRVVCTPAPKPYLLPVLVLPCVSITPVFFLASLDKD